MTLLTTSDPKPPIQPTSQFHERNNSERYTSSNRIKNQLSILDHNLLPPRMNSGGSTRIISAASTNTILNPKDLFKSPSQQQKISFNSYRKEEKTTPVSILNEQSQHQQPQLRSNVQNTRNIYELKIKNFNNDTKSTKLFAQSSKITNGQQQNKYSKWSTSGPYEPSENLMLEAQRRLSYNVSVAQTNSKQQQQQSEKQKFLNRTSNCYENARVKYDDYDFDDLDINVADINYEDDDIFGEDDDIKSTNNESSKTSKFVPILTNTIPTHHHMHHIHHKTKNSSESSASTSTSSISASSSLANQSHKQHHHKHQQNHHRQLKQKDLEKQARLKDSTPVLINTNMVSGSPFASSNSSSSISYSAAQQLKKYKYQPPEMQKSSTTNNNSNNNNIYMLKKSSNQISNDASSIVVTNKTEFKFLQPSSSSSYSSSGSPSPTSSQPPSPQQQLQPVGVASTATVSIMSPPPPPPPPPSSSETYSIMPTLVNFSHFDLQSVLFNYDQLKQIKDTLHKSVNTRTGASAASRQSSFENLNKTLPATTSGNLLLGKDYLQATHNHLNETTHEKQRKKSTNNLESIATPSAKRLSSSLFVYLNEDETSMPNKRLSDCSSTRCSDLVEECAPFFKLELGGDTFKGLGLVEEVSQRRMMKLNSISCLDKISHNYKKEIIDLIESNNNEPFTIEYQDYGAYFYRYYFSNYDHANYVGIDSNIGPVAISIRREKLFFNGNNLSPRNSNNNPLMLNNNNNNDAAYEYGYRFIFRTSGLNTLRGTILEENIYSKNSATSIGTKHGIAHKEILGYLMPELDLSCLRLADNKLNEKLIKLDEQCIIKTHKIGVLLCKAGQSTEEEMYNNKDSTPAFDEFLQLLGEKVALKGFSQYRGVLDTTNDTTGTHSVYTRFRDKEIMFHVSTLLPHSNNDKQQLTRKRHIGNDLVTIVFQEPGSLPFSPRTIRSHFQHIFIVVRAYNPNTIHTQYSVAISYSKDVPSFGPPLPKNPLFYKSKEFRDFLLAKIVNADNAGLKCDKFTQIRMRAQHGILKEFAQLYSTKLTLDNCGYNGNSNSVMHKFGIFNFGSIKLKKTRSKSVHSYNNNSIMNSGDDNLVHLNGAIFWTLEFIQDSQYSFFNSCYFGISKQYVVSIDTKRKSVIFSVGCNAIIGWNINEIDKVLTLYYDQGEYVLLRFKTRSDMYQCVKRLENFTKGCRTIELSLEKKDYGQLGFSIHHDGVVTEVEPYSLAYYRGLKQGTRIVKIGDHFVINLNHEKMIDILRKSTCLKVVFLTPFDDGTARRGHDDSYSLYAYLSTCSSLNERLIDSFRTNTPIQSYAYFDQFNAKTDCSPSAQMRRFSNFSNPKKSAQNRLSSTSATIYNYTPTANANPTSNGINVGSAYSNSYYSSSLGSDIASCAVKPNDDDVVILSSNKQRDKITEKSNGSTSSNISTSRLKVQNSTNLEWANLVRTASKAFENAHKNSDSTDLINHKPIISNNYISTNEIIDNNDFQKYCQLNKEKTISIDELKNTFIQLQLELNQEKLEKKLTTSKIAGILEENLTLKQQLMRLKDENDQLKNQNKPVLKHSDI